MAMLLFDCLVALAGGFAQTFKIEYLDFTPRVLNHPRFLERARDCSHAGSPDAQHLSQKLLRERKVVVVASIRSRAQEPAAKPGINFMIGPAGS